MEVTIKNCNSIDEAKIKIVENKLNIKYGINGTGKSTIAKALIHNTTDPSLLISLLPFKHRGGDNENKFQPHVEGAESIQSIEIFNEDFINQFIFKEDDLVENSFEIFIKTKEYDIRMVEVERNLEELRTTFSSNENLTQIVRDLLELSQYFGKSTKTQSYSAASTIGKGIGKGNKLVSIPQQLISFSDYLTSEVNVEWINWQIKGNKYIDISSACPYCTSSTQDKKDIIKSIEKEFDSKAIEHLNKLKEITNRLSRYFSEEANNKFSSLFSSATNISKEGQGFLNRLKDEIDVLLDKLNALKTLSFYSLREVEKVVEKISAMKIDMQYQQNLSSTETITIVNEVNSSLDKVITQAGKIQGEIAKQKAQIERTIQEHKSGINAFLKYAGYRYSIEITPEGETYKMKLRHEDSAEAFTEGNKHLSFGERNAFSIVLFMYNCLSKKPDLIILDDPISSFDRNKKFALIDTLFRKTSSLKGKTVLMFTHDIEPIVDMLFVKNEVFSQGTVASFLESHNGVIREIPILSSDIISFSEVCEDVVKSDHDEIVKLIHLRRLHEIWNKKEMVYQLISNLFHKRDVPVFMEVGFEDRIMTSDEINCAIDKIEREIPSFNYDSTLSRLKDENEMIELYKSTKHHHAKLQIFRIIKQDKHDSNVITKFINESYHIENEYVMQLHPSKYESIPRFIIDECDKVLFGTI